MLLSHQNDSDMAGQRTKTAGPFVANSVVVVALVALALFSRGSSALIAETTQAEFVSPDLHSAAAVQIAQPSVKAWTARTN